MTPIKDRISLGKAMWRSLDHRNPISMLQAAGFRAGQNSAHLRCGHEL